MYANGVIMVLHTLTATHAGSGTELSHVDLPIQREVHTHFPQIEASTLKGSIRDALGKGEEVDVLLGSFEKGEYASAVSISDARLLFFPVKSALGVFGWITCPLALSRFFDDYKLVFEKPFDTELVMNQGGNYYGDSCKLLETTKSQIMLEDCTFTVEPNEKFRDVLIQIKGKLPPSQITNDRFLDHTVLLPDDDFAYFVSYATEIHTRIKIDPATGTVKEGALFTEEFLPPESILYSPLFFSETHLPQGEENGKNLTAQEVRNKFIELFGEKAVFQLGGDMTLGKGLVAKSLWGVKA